MTHRNPNPLVHLGVKLPPALALALKTTAAARGTTASSIVRDALAKEVSSVPNPGKKPQHAA